jgi:hypothetical protein
MGQEKKEFSESTTDESLQKNIIIDVENKEIDKYKLMQKLFIFTVKTGGIRLLSIHHIHLLILFPIITE